MDWHEEQLGEWLAFLEFDSDDERNAAHAQNAFVLDGWMLQMSRASARSLEFAKEQRSLMTQEVQFQASWYPTADQFLQGGDPGGCMQRTGKTLATEPRTLAEQRFAAVKSAGASSQVPPLVMHAATLSSHASAAAEAPKPAVVDPKLLRPFLKVAWVSDLYGPLQISGDPSSGMLDVQAASVAASRRNVVVQDRSIKLKNPCLMELKLCLQLSDWCMHIVWQSPMDDRETWTLAPVPGG
mmetsp:Transcript_3016/g.10264  ORF Transcript_3016/g.10264 Transcript_3016/m.10264 type:complete len:240 (-) Transcript_3016:4-723(-)